MKPTPGTRPLALPVLPSEALRRAELLAHDASRELEQRLAQQSAVARLGELGLRGTDTGALLRSACETVADALAVELAMVMEHQGDGLMEVAAGGGRREGHGGSRLQKSSLPDVRRPAGHHAPPLGGAEL